MKHKGAGEKSELQGDTMSTHRLLSEFPSPVYCSGDRKVLGVATSHC